MTAMLADLVAVVADEVRAAAELRSEAANDDGGDLFERLRASGLLDIEQLMALLLRRAEQERLAAAIRARGNGGSAHFLHALAADQDSDISAAAMALILGRSRRRDRFDLPRIDLDDVPANVAVRLVYAVTAALRGEASSSGTEADRRLSDAAGAVFARHNEGRRMEALSFALIHAFDSAVRLDDETFRSALADGEVALVAEALARRAGVDFETAWNQFVSGGRQLANLLRMAGVPRPFAAQVAATLGDSTARGPGELICRFDALSQEQSSARATGCGSIEPIAFQSRQLVGPMATRPTDPGPVTGRIDASGRLVAADPALEALQRDAGSSLGAPVAIPQLAAIVRIARQLKIPVSRRAVAAGADQDVDMWVRAVPEGEEVALTIERWSARPPTRPRLASLSDVEPDAAGARAAGRSTTSFVWSSSPRLPPS